MQNLNIVCGIDLQSHFVQELEPVLYFGDRLNL